MKFVYVQIIKLDIFKVMIIGRISAISTSKIKKIIAIKKNRIEKGKREELNGVNPHSKGESFSRSLFFFFAKREESHMTINAIIKMIRDIIRIFRIIYINKN